MDWGHVGKKKIPLEMGRIAQKDRKYKICSNVNIHYSIIEYIFSYETIKNYKLRIIH